MRSITLLPGTHSSEVASFGVSFYSSGGLGGIATHAAVVRHGIVDRGLGKEETLKATFSSM